MNEYLEYEKLKKVQAKSQACGEFLDWLVRTYGVNVQRKCKYKSTEVLLAEFFEIDLQKLEQEKRAMLAGLGAQLEGTVFIPSDEVKKNVETCR